MTELSACQRVCDGYAPEEEAELARILRAEARSDDPQQVEKAMEALEMMRTRIAAEFPLVTPELMEETRGSVGYSLFALKTKPDTVIKVLLREARLLNTASLIALSTFYRYWVDGYEKRDPRILECFEELAAEDWRPVQELLGEILMKAAESEVDRKRAIEMLESAATSKSLLLLADDAFVLGDDEKLEAYLRAATRAGNDPQAHYNLGVLLQKQVHYAEAIQSFKQALQIDDKYHEARLELGRMHIEGWGTRKDPRLGAAMMKRVVEESDNELLAGIAHANLGFLYRSGNGVEKSAEKSMYHLKLAAEAGVAAAKDLLADR
jgi:tetratricopeptide (TPR) repeat protein